MRSGQYARDPCECGVPWVYEDAYCERGELGAVWGVGGGDADAEVWGDGGGGARLLCVGLRGRRLGLLRAWHCRLVGGLLHSEDEVGGVLCGGV